MEIFGRASARLKRELVDVNSYQENGNITFPKIYSENEIGQRIVSPSAMHDDD